MTRESKNLSVPTRSPGQASVILSPMVIALSHLRNATIKKIKITSHYFHNILYVDAIFVSIRAIYSAIYSAYQYIFLGKQNKGLPRNILLIGTEQINVFVKDPCVGPARFITSD